MACRIFQLSEDQIEHFAALKEVGGSAETVLPFAKESDSRTENNFVRVEEAPLRIYKNEYDKPPPSSWPRYSCVIKQGDPGFASFEETMKAIEEIGLDQIPPTFSGPFPPPPPPL